MVYECAAHQKRNGRLQLVTDLAGTPMNSCVLVYQDIPFYWDLSAVAKAEHDCVPYSLAESLNEDPEYCKRHLETISNTLKQNPEEGFTRECVIKFLEEYSEVIGKQIGWKCIVDGVCVSQRKAANKAPFVGWCQRAGHMYLYKQDCAALRQQKPGNKKTLRVGIKQYNRHLAAIPEELRTICKSKTSVALAIWELKRIKQNRKNEIPQQFSIIQPGRFYCKDIDAAQLELIRKGLAPTCQMGNLFKKTGLFVRLSPTETFCLVQEPENYELLSKLAEYLQLPYSGASDASFAYSEQQSRGGVECKQGRQGR